MPGQPDYLSFADLTGFGPNGLLIPPNAHMDWDVTGPPSHPGMAASGGGVHMQQQHQHQQQFPEAGHVILLPQDLTTLPMSLDWDWAEMSGGAYPSVENGNFGPMGRG
jgi:hypothetical protein